MMQLRNRCNQRVSWGLTCDLNPHSSKVVHSMQCTVCNYACCAWALSACFTTGVVRILRNNITAYMCYNLEYILQFCWILCIFLQRIQKHQISPDTRGCVPLVLKTSPAYMCNDSSIIQKGSTKKLFFLGIIPKPADRPPPSVLLGMNNWILSKFRNKNVNFMAKNSGHQKLT